MTIRRLCFRDIAPGCAFHAARVALSAAQRSRVDLHSHDFYEWIVVLSGGAGHLVNGRDAPLRAGTLFLIRPDDTHEIVPEQAEATEFINLAFPQDAWRDFVTATALEPFTGRLMDEPSGVRVEMTAQEIIAVNAAALAALRAFHERADRLAFCALWHVAARCLLNHAPDSPSDAMPPSWLRDACEWARSTSVADVSLEALTARSGVSYGHLCRAMQKAMSVSPTQFLGALRLRRAAYLLATTDMSITDVAFDCGFETLSYFYRRFSQMYDQTPRAFRHRARQAVTPTGRTPLVRDPSELVEMR